MPDNQYQFVSRWNVEGTCGEVADVLADLTALAQWWPAVYLTVELARRRATSDHERAQVAPPPGPVTLMFRSRGRRSRGRSG